MPKPHGPTQLGTGMAFVGQRCGHGVARQAHTATCNGRVARNGHVRGDVLKTQLLHDQLQLLLDQATHGWRLAVRCSSQWFTTWLTQWLLITTHSQWLTMVDRC